MPTPPPSSNLPELLYVQDPLCSWCYGMSPVISRIQQEFAGRVDVSVMCSGMVEGAEVTPIAETWNELQNRLRQVEAVAGVQIGEAFWKLGEDGQYIFDSEPPSRAIAIFRQLTQAPTRTVAFAHAVQTALFRDGKDLNEVATYVPLLAPFGVNVSDFAQRWPAPEMARATQQEFAAVARIGIEGLPTAVVRIGEQGYMLARGYQPYAQLSASLEQLLREEM